MTTPIDWDDNCARAAALRQAYYELISGRQAYEISYTANGVARTVRYSVIDMKLLLQEIRDAETLCAAETGVPVARRRYAITAGSMRRPWLETESE